MSKMIATKMDNILAGSESCAFTVDLNNDHYPDRKDFHKEVFTPYAAFDPKSGVSYSRFDNEKQKWIILTEQEYNDFKELYPNQSEFYEEFRITLGNSESSEQIQIRKLALGMLLKDVLGGHESGTEEHIAIIQGPRDGTNILCFDVKTLFSRILSHGKERPMDFPRRILSIYKLEDEITACRFAWAIVRGALTNRWELVHDLIRDAENVKNTKNVKDKAAPSQRLRNNLSDAINLLKQEKLL